MSANKFFDSTLWLAVVLFATIVLLTTAATAQSDFTVVLLPDTQNYSESFPNVFNRQTQWIAANASTLNIQLVLGLGDVVRTSSQAYEWQNADAAVRVLENAGIPTFIAIGNHDYDNVLTRSARSFNQYFGPSRYQGKPWYRGQYPSASNENFYGQVTLGGETYVVLVLEYVPRTAALNWAKSVLDANAGKKVLVVEHSFMNSDGTRVDVCDTGDMNSDNNGEALWMSLLRNYGNIVMIVSGHVTTGGGHSRRVDLGVKGNIVRQMLSDYEDYQNGGSGYLRILKFHPSTGKINVSTYSPYLNSSLTGALDQFTLYSTPPPVSGTATVSGRVRTARIGSTQDCSPIAGATVTTPAGQTTTDSNGAYSLALPALASYSISSYLSNWNVQTQTVNAWVNYPADLEFFLTPKRGTISGYVRNAAGSGVGGASVNAAGGFVNFNRTVKTDSTGYYTTGLVAIGTYTVTASATAHGTQQKKTVVSTDTTTTLNFSSF
jgi:hypothetical protein